MHDPTSGDTIAAPITAPGQAAVAAVRLSGGQTQRILSKLLDKPGKLLSRPRSLQLLQVLDFVSGNEAELLDTALCAYFPAPNSFTGEDCLEFHLHGSPFVVRRLMENLCAAGARLAEPGEFTQRAFLNGRMDLSQAEAVADVIAAETEAQARVAQQQLAGKLHDAIDTLGEPLRNLLAEIEAFIDFPDEDIEPASIEQWKREVAIASEQIGRYLASFRTGRLYREGAQVVLAGIPNAGKSSLMNALVGETRAIVTPIAGTTRDSIDTRIDLDGLHVSLWDTAGLVDGALADRLPDEVEQIGIARSWQHLETADIALFVFAADEDLLLQTEFFLQVSKRCRQIVALLNKIDLVDPPRRNELSSHLEELLGAPPKLISALEGSGLADLKVSLRAELIGSGPKPASVLVSNQRHYEALVQAADALDRALDVLKEKEVGAEFVALELRTALGALSDIVGVTYTEDILGRIFSKFCIGK